jgi:hypothetical protein
MLRNMDLGYMGEDRSPMLYSVTFSFLASAVCMVVLRKLLPVLTLYPD